MIDFRVPRVTLPNLFTFCLIVKIVLVELTRLGKIINRKRTEIESDKYINEFLDYEIGGSRKGIIPMNSSISNQNSPNKCVSIGTRAGNVNQVLAMHLKTW